MPKRWGTSHFDTLEHAIAQHASAEDVQDRITRGKIRIGAPEPPPDTASVIELDSDGRYWLVVG